MTAREGSEKTKGVVLNMYLTTVDLSRFPEEIVGVDEWNLLLTVPNTTVITGILLISFELCCCKGIELAFSLQDL